MHVYYLLKELARNHSVSLLCLNDVPVQAEEKEAINKLGVTLIQVIQHPVPQNFFARLLNTFFDPVPFFVRQFQSEPLAQELRKFLSSRKIDLIHVDYLSMALYHKEFPSFPAVFFPHDAVSMLFERNVASETNCFRKLYTFLQYKKIKRFETYWIPKFQGTMVVSPVDRTYLLRHCPNAKIAVAVNGVDCDYFAPQKSKEEENSILFRGVMNFLPNLDAARFFYREVLPFIHKEIPNAKFYVVGKSPPIDLLKCAETDRTLMVMDYVPDLREWMAKASVIVCPMRIGSGIKNKILESMAMAKAIVSTPMACAGLEVVQGEHLFMETSPELFARRVISLLKDKEAREALGAKSRAFVQERYTWGKNAEAFERLYEEAIQKYPAAER